MRAPVLAVGDGALGFWAALRDVFPETREQRCWVHKIGQRPRRAAEVGAARRRRRCWPRSATPRTATTPAAAAKRFDAEFGAKWPKAVAKITDDLDGLLTFYDFPAEHWIHLRTTNPIESTFATVRLRTKVTKGPGSRAAGLAMAFKLIESAQDRWRAVNGPHLVALVRAGARFERGVLIERIDPRGLNDARLRHLRHEHVDTAQNWPTRADRLTVGFMERESDYRGIYLVAPSPHRLEVQPNAIPGDDDQDDVYDHEHPEMQTLLLVTGPDQDNELNTHLDSVGGLTLLARRTEDPPIHNY